MPQTKPRQGSRRGELVLEGTVSVKVAAVEGSLERLRTLVQGSQMIVSPRNDASSASTRHDCSPRVSLCICVRYSPLRRLVWSMVLKQVLRTRDIFVDFLARPQEITTA